ncbi:hypothetical protein C8R47DRAFT_1072153 [Mycena vitilis]|nr:hypothetical protein C8R47DRAFT_1072153 [Mycena vitilis]
MGVAEIHASSSVVPHILGIQGQGLEVVGVDEQILPRGGRGNAGWRRRATSRKSEHRECMPAASLGGNIPDIQRDGYAPQHDGIPLGAKRCQCTDGPPHCGGSTSGAAPAGERGKDAIGLMRPASWWRLRRWSRSPAPIVVLGVWTGCEKESVNLELSRQIAVNLLVIGFNPIEALLLFWRSKYEIGESGDTPVRRLTLPQQATGQYLIYYVERNGRKQKIQRISRRLNEPGDGGARTATKKADQAWSSNHLESSLVNVAGVGRLIQSGGLMKIFLIGSANEKEEVSGVELRRYLVAMEMDRRRGIVKGGMQGWRGDHCVWNRRTSEKISSPRVTTPRLSSRGATANQGRAAFGQ